MNTRLLAIVLTVSTIILIMGTTLEPVNVAHQKIRQQKHHYVGPFVASKYSDVYHQADCPNAKRISLENRVYFETTEEAEANGYRACMVCRPG